MGWRYSLDRQPVAQTHTHTHTNIHTFINTLWWERKLSQTIPVPATTSSLCVCASAFIHLGSGWIALHKKKKMNEQKLLRLLFYKSFIKILTVCSRKKREQGNMRKRMSGQGKNDIEERTKKQTYEVVINGHEESNVCEVKRLGPWLGLGSCICVFGWKVVNRGDWKICGCELLGNRYGPLALRGLLYNNL